MPTYEYSCEKCGQNFDAFQSIGTGAGLIFKGSGFYITDYRSDSYKEAAKKEAPATSSGGEKSATPKEPAKGSSPAQTKTPQKKPAKESG